MQSISDIAKLAYFRLKNADVSRTQGVCHVIHKILDLLWFRYNCAKYHHCTICLTDFREEGFLPPRPIREQPQKSLF